MMDMKKSPLTYDIDTQRQMAAGGHSTLTCPSSAIRDCCGGGQLTQHRPQRAATLNYRATPQCPDLSAAAKSSTLGRRAAAATTNTDSGFCRGETCDVIQSGLIQEHHQTDVSDKILWKFDCDIVSATNNPDVVTRTALPDAIVSRTTTL